METFLVLVVYVVGIGLMVAELLMPGVVFGFIGLACLISSVAMAFLMVDDGGLLGWILVGSSVVLVPLFVLIWVKFMGTFFSLKGSEESYIASEDRMADLMGRDGVSITALRPAGMARIDDRRVDVVSMGELIDAGTRVKVVEVKGNRVVVRRMPTG